MYASYTYTIYNFGTMLNFNWRPYISCLPIMYSLYTNQVKGSSLFSDFVYSGLFL